MGAIETFKANGFTVEIHHDPDTENPHNEQFARGCQLAMRGDRYDWPNDAGIVFGDFDGWGEIAGVLRANYDAVVVDYVYVYDHSGVSFTTGERTYPFDDRWDSGNAGLAYVTRSGWKESQGADWTGTDEEITQAHALIAGEVEIYGQWAGGECYGYRIIDEYGELREDCWSYIGYDNVTQAANSAAAALEHEIKCNGKLDRKAGAIGHDGPCPMHG
jgi:hypothetical protein